MADRYRGTLYVGVTATFQPISISTERAKDQISANAMHCIAWYGPSMHRRSPTPIAHEKRVKRWQREWKFALIERGNPEWQDLFDPLA